MMQFPWARYAVRRGIGLVWVLAALLVATFLIVRLIPGDPARRVAGLDATAEDVERTREALGLNKSLPEQFVDYVSAIVRFEFGRSFVTREPVAKVVADRFPKTVQLAVTALAIVMLGAVPLGLLFGALTREGRRRRLEIGFAAVTSLGGALPEYLAATFLAFVFAVWLRWLPVAGSTEWHAIVLPAVAIALRPTTTLSRIVRVETLNVLAQDYIRTARGKRLPAALIYFRHTLPNVLTAALTIGGTLFTGLIAGAVVVENVFAWPGLGTQLVQAILTRDYPVVQAVTLMLGCAVVLVNTAVELLLAVVDPRSVIKA